MNRTLLVAGLLIRLTYHASPLTAQEPEGFRPPPSKYEHTIEKNVMVAMRDGVRLATDLYRPAGLTGRLPVVLIRTPYGKDGYQGATGKVVHNREVEGGSDVVVRVKLAR